MSDKAYHEADMEVIAMVNNRKGRGGQLPGKVVRYIPEERAGAVLALDARIEKLRSRIPGLAILMAIILALLIGLNL
jgi:hypothetical protein